MANSGTGHGRTARIYVKTSGVPNYELIPKLGSNGTAVSEAEVQEPNNFQEDTGQGDVTKTYVPDIGDFSASLTFFMQDANTDHIQYRMMQDARNQRPVDVLIYPMLGAGVANFYYKASVYLSLGSLPIGVSALISAQFEMRAAGAITLNTPV
jgi:hypothetical protein